MTISNLLMQQPKQGNCSEVFPIKEETDQNFQRKVVVTKIHKATSNQFNRRLKFVAKELYDVELVASVKEHNESIIAGFFILQYDRLRLLKMFYTFLMLTCLKSSK